MTNYTNQWIVVKFDALREEYGGVCSVEGCEAVSELHFAHIKPTPISEINRGRGRKERYYDIINHRESYRLMCGFHHRLYDKGEDSDFEGPPAPI